MKFGKNHKMKNVMPYMRISKEKIGKLHPARSERYAGGDHKQIRGELMKALFLGNVFQQKVVIDFHTLEGDFEVETTVWSVTDEHVGLKGSVRLPVECVESVRLL